MKTTEMKLTWSTILAYHLRISSSLKWGHAWGEARGVVWNKTVISNGLEEYDMQIMIIEELLHYFYIFNNL